MLDAQAALERAGIPGFRVSLRMGEMQEIPPVFGVWALRSEPGIFIDDSPAATIHEVKMHLIALSDPRPAWSNLQGPMEEEGFALVDMQESYDEDADVYVIMSQWRGVEYHEI